MYDKGEGAIDLLGGTPRMPQPGERGGPVQSPLWMKVYLAYALLMPVLVAVSAAVVPGAYHNEYKRWVAGMLPAIYVVTWLRIFPAAVRLWSGPPDVLELDEVQQVESPAESRSWLLAALVAIGFVVLALWDWGVFVGRIRTVVFEGANRMRFPRNGLVIHLLPAEDWLALTRVESGLRTMGIALVSGLLGWIACWTPDYLRERGKAAAHAAVTLSATAALAGIIWRLVN